MFWRSIIISSFVLTISLAGFAAVILPAPRTTVKQLPQTKTITTTTTTTTNRPIGSSVTRQTITRQTTIHTRPININSSNPRLRNTPFPFQTR